MLIEHEHHVVAQAKRDAKSSDRVEIDIESHYRVRTQESRSPLPNWIALALTRDPLHLQARELWELLHGNGARLRTSVPVVIETFTFLERNAHLDVALAWKDSLNSLRDLEILDCGRGSFLHREPGIEMAGGWCWRSIWCRSCRDLFVPIHSEKRGCFPVSMLLMSVTR